MAGPPAETFTLSLEVAGRRIEGRVALPSDPVPATTMLPVVHAIADAVVRLTGESLAEGGTPITCGPGCAACCRKLVPISAIEARGLRALVEALPERVRLPRSVSNALAGLEPTGWVPLARALARADRLAAEPAPRSGGAWLQAVLDGSE